MIGAVLWNDRVVVGVLLFNVTDGKGDITSLQAHMLTVMLDGQRLNTGKGSLKLSCNSVGNEDNNLTARQERCAMLIGILIERVAIRANEHNTLILYVKGNGRHLRAQRTVNSRTAVGRFHSREENIGLDVERGLWLLYIRHTRIFCTVFNRHRHLATLVDDLSNMVAHINFYRYRLFWQSTQQRDNVNGQQTERLEVAAIVKRDTNRHRQRIFL